MRTDATGEYPRAGAGGHGATVADHAEPRGSGLTAAYVTLADPLDVNAWSGLNRHIALALEGQGVSMEYVGALKDPLSAVKKVRHHAGTALRLPSYLGEGSHISARSFARQARRRMTRDCDVVFSTGTIPLAYLDTDRPM